MNDTIQVYYGEGKGKTAAAIGHAIRFASRGKSVVVIRFLKGNNKENYQILERLEPEIRVFQFDKEEIPFKELGEEEQKEEISNVRNALNYAKKVLSTGESDMVILDEVLGLVDEEIATSEEILQVLECKNEETVVVLTGRCLDETIRNHADEVYQIKSEK